MEDLTLAGGGEILTWQMGGEIFLIFFDPKQNKNNTTGSGLKKQNYTIITLITFNPNDPIC